MNIFKKLFSPTASAAQIPVDDLASEERKISAEDDSQDQKSSKIYTISVATHMPIDAIYIFLDKDFEEMGYKDAMCSADSTYRDSGVRIIRNELKALFRRVTLRYKDELRNLDTTIRMVREQGMLDQASALGSRVETINEHLEEIQKMEADLDSDQPSMMRPVESYTRGFIKGITARTSNFLTD